MQAVENVVKQVLCEFAKYLFTNRDKLSNDYTSIVDVWLLDQKNRGHTDPKTMTTKIAAMTTDDSESSEQCEIKTNITGLDSEAEESVAAVPVPVDDESEVVEVKKSKQAPKQSKKESKPDKKPVKVEVEEESDELVEVDEEPEESEEPAPVAKKAKSKPAPKGKKAKVEEEEESEPIVDVDEEDDSEPIPVVKKPTKKATGGMELSDTPKLPVKDRPKLPKDIKFLKGTNNVVVAGKVVAAVSKKGIGKLSKTNTKPLTEKNIPFEEWTDDKIKKTFKL